MFDLDDRDMQRFIHLVHRKTEKGLITWRWGSDQVARADLSKHRLELHPRKEHEKLPVPMVTLMLIDSGTGRVLEAWSDADWTDKKLYVLRLYILVRRKLHQVPEVIRDIIEELEALGAGEGAGDDGEDGGECPY